VVRARLSFIARVRYDSPAVVFFLPFLSFERMSSFLMVREIVHIQAGQCGNQIGAKI